MGFSGRKHYWGAGSWVEEACQTQVHTFKAALRAAEGLEPFMVDRWPEKRIRRHRPGIIEADRTHTLSSSAPTAQG